MAGLLDRLLGAPISAAQPTGLLTADDYANARRQGLMGLGSGLLAASGGGNYQNLNQRLAEGIQGGQGAYQQALDRAQAHAAASQNYDLGQLRLDTGRQDLAAGKQDQARLQQIRQMREQIIQANPMPDSADSATFAQWIDRVLPAFIRIGDRETVSQLAEVRKSIEPKAHPLQTTNLGDRTQWTDAQTGALVKEERNGQGPGTLKIATEMTPVQQERLWNTALSQFGTQANQAGYVKAHDAWNALEQVRARALSGQVGKEDLIQLIDGISRLNNPGAIVRQGTIRITMDKLGSWADKLKLWRDQGLYGKLTPELALSIVANAQQLAAEHAKQYGKLRGTIMKRGEHLGLPGEYIEASTPNVWGDSSVGGSAAPAAVAPRLPNETIPAYLQRTGGGQ
jgi:hypothetical protein